MMPDGNITRPRRCLLRAWDGVIVGPKGDTVPVVNMRIDDLDFDLPAELIAQTPSDKRSRSRLLHYQRGPGEGRIAHRHFADLPSLLRAGDLLVFNDAKVVPARFMLSKSTGGLVEGLFLSETQRGLWDVLLKNVGRSPHGMELTFEREPTASARIVEALGEGRFRLQVAVDEPAIVLLSRIGRMPLPPYIRRRRGNDERDDTDRVRYQTVYARAEGSVAAPTAGLHFDQPLLETLLRSGIQPVFITLHVGLGTFKPITADSLDGHIMHEEAYSLSRETAEALNCAKAESRRIIAVGTTAARVLESQPAGRPFVAADDRTSIFIRPPYRWKHVDGLITNFHLPRSTLIALVAALVGLDEQKRIYRQAIQERYRFFSYGDAMLIE